MDFEQWNQALGDAFLREGPGRPVYLSVTEAELHRVSDDLSLGLSDPVEDLRAAVRPYSFLAMGHRHRPWVETKSTELPPWLPFLAATTIVVDQQVQSGSLAFYRPLAEFLRHPNPISQREYEPTFFAWWVELKAWLTEPARHDGMRGFPTWGSIPQSGPRSVIGHPYTQVMLRREERRQIEDFLAEFDHLNSEPPDAADRLAVAEHLVAALRRWAREHKSLSGRLRRILEGTNLDETLSLGYLLLDRLFDEHSGRQRADSAVRVVKVVPAYDDYERELRIVALAPSWVRPSEPVHLDGTDDALREPGDMVAVDLPITDELLTEGATVGADVGRMVASPRYVMAARDWALWCTVEGAFPGEEIHLLIASAEAQRLALPQINGVRGLPDGWSVAGPLTVDHLPSEIAATTTAASRQLVPRLSGGLTLQPRVYLVGGEPQLELAGYAGEVTINGRLIDGDGDQLLLASLNLEEGDHTVTAGGFSLPFRTVRSRQFVEIVPSLGRNRFGEVSPITETDDCVTGARRFPSSPPPWHRGLIPKVDRFYKLGLPGEIGVVEDPLMAPWAQHLGLSHTAVEVDALTTHPHRDRLVRRPQWVAWMQPGVGWTVIESSWNPAERDEDAPYNPVAWRRACRDIGPEPHSWTSNDAAETAAVHARWQAYCAAEAL